MTASNFRILGRLFLQKRESRQNLKVKFVEIK
jgi:hypothetical protein